MDRKRSDYKNVNETFKGFGLNVPRDTNLGAWVGSERTGKLCIA